MSSAAVKGRQQQNALAQRSGDVRARAILVRLAACKTLASKQAEHRVLGAASGSRKDQSSAALGGAAELGDAGSLWQALCECEAVAAAAGATEPKRSRIDTPAPASAGHAQRQRPRRPPRPPKATPGQIPVSARRDATAQRVTMAHRAHLRRAAANAGPNSSCVRRPSSRAPSTRHHRAMPSTRRHRTARPRRASHAQAESPAAAAAATASIGPRPRRPQDAAAHGKKRRAPGLPAPPLHDAGTGGGPPHQLVRRRPVLRGAGQGRLRPRDAPALLPPQPLRELPAPAQPRTASRSLMKASCASSTPTS